MFPKFRAWCKHTTGEGWFMCREVRWLNLETQTICTESGMQPSEFVLMQYTGINDCKRTDKYPEGQPIYDGDIVIVNYGMKDRQGNIINEQNCEDRLAVIVFEDGMFTHGWCEPDLDGDLLLVVGNIYENRDLLKWPTLNPDE